MKKFETSYPDKGETSYKGEGLALTFAKSANAKLGEGIAPLASCALINYVYSPTVIDNFKDNDDRRNYYNQVVQKEDIKAYEEYLNNRLRLQNIRKVVCFFYFLQLQYSFLKTPDLIESAERIIKRFLHYGIGEPDITAMTAENYDRLEIRQKISLTIVVAGFARRLCVRIIEAD